MSKKAVNSGQALIELVLAIAIATTLLAVLATGVIAAREGSARTSKSLEANIILQKEIEAIRSVRETAWNSITTPDTYHTQQSGNGWVAASGTTTEGEFTRGFTVVNVCRQDSTSPPIDCGSPQAIVDPSTKEITVSVSWTFLGTKLASSTFYLTRYSGNQTWLQTTKEDFDAGTHNNTQSTKKGVLELITGAALNFTGDYLDENEYTFDSNKIEVAGSFAQLKAQGSTISGQTTNPGFDSGISNWTFASWEDATSQSGNYRASGGNPGGYAEINLPASRRSSSGGYWYQSFTTTVSDPTATLSFDWKVTNYNQAPRSFRVYAFVGSGSGPPDASQNVYDSGEITGTTAWGTSGDIDVSSKVTNPGTYYFKVAVFVQHQKNKTTGPYTAGFDNALLTWSKTIGSYPVDKPTIYRNSSFTAPSISSWGSFTEVAEKNGGSIGYQLSDNDGASWKYYNGSSWMDTTTSYNDAATINNNIGSFPTTNNKINVRAFLISNGTQFVRLDRVVIGYTGTSTGTFTCSTFDAGDLVSFNRLVWTENQAAATTIKFQIATNTDNTTWNFVGPDGTIDTYFTGGSGILHLSTVPGRYVQYRIYFTSATSDKPSVEDVIVNYSP